MLRFVVGRVLGAIPLLAVVLTVTFFLGELSPVDPAELIVGDNATTEQVEAVRAEYGLDRPVLERYGEWVGDAVRGDLGESLYSNASVATLIWNALPVTLSLTFGGLLFAVLAGLPAGVASALRVGRSTDRLLSLGTALGQSVPGFWLGFGLIFVFALRLGWFPAVGFTGPTDGVGPWLRSILLPSVALGAAAAASIARQTRSAMIGELQQDYVRTALAKGLARRRIIYVHALKNAAAPVVTVLAFQAAALLGGSIVIERLFVLPGIGKFTIEAVLRHDPNVVQGVVALAVIVVVIVNLLLDLAYFLLNPKVRPR